MALTGKESTEELETQAEKSEELKISMVEATVFLTIAGAADTIEIILPVIGVVFGLAADGIILLWAFLRGLRGGFLVKQGLIQAGDLMTAGVVPIRTIGLAITILMNNASEGKNLEEVLKFLNKA